MVVFLIGFVLMVFAPPFVTERIYGNDAATGAMFFSFLLGVGALGLWQFPESRRHRREIRRHNLLFDGYEKRGPLGTWGAIDCGDFPNVSGECTLEFQEDGRGRILVCRRGRFKETLFTWRHIARESSAVGAIELHQMNWQADSHQIVEFIVAPYADSPRLSLMINGALARSIAEIDADGPMTPLNKSDFWPDEYQFKLLELRHH